ncbi:hypothetical protein [Nocardia sp. BMG51109]|uniref:hypothetical protein n=1 Tax=Nocardia sp. BMG51109 TaxID=1056816 RepID=UPI0012EB6D09|nr:hypothetical protein [Nocardia sp. BMG51109]
MKSAFAKLSRARKHLENFETSLTDYRDSDAIRFDVRHRTDPLDSQQVIIECIARLKVPPPSEDWGLMIGDILTNLRGALDHALFGHIVARHPGLTEDEQRSIQFPVVDDPAKWPIQERKYIDPSTPWVDRAVWNEIAANQPMHSSDPSHQQLHVLHRLVVLDKHRTIHVVVHRASASLDESYNNLTELPQGGQPLMEGAVLARGRALRPLAGPPRPERGRGGTAYLELLEVPGYTHDQMGALRTMQGMVDVTGRFLDRLKAAGC